MHGATAELHANFNTGDTAQAVCLAGRHKPVHPHHAVVVGQGHGGEPCLDCLLH